MYKIIISFFLLCSLAQAQDIYPNAVSRAVTIKIDTLANDSTVLFILPAGVMLEGVYISIDSTITGSPGDSIKIGIQGERPLSPFRFADFPYDSMAQGTKDQLSHHIHRQNVVGMLYAYENEVTTAATDADTYYRIQGLLPFPANEFGLTATNSLVCPPYRDGLYMINTHISFSSSKANVLGHGEVFRNATGFDFVAFERTISTASSTGDASANGVVYLSEGDSVYFALKSDVASAVFTIPHAQLTVRKASYGHPYVTDAERQMWLYTTAATGQIRVFIKYRELY